MEFLKVVAGYLNVDGNEYSCKQLEVSKLDYLGQGYTEGVSGCGNRKFIIPFGLVEKGIYFEPPHQHPQPPHQQQQQQPQQQQQQPPKKEKGSEEVIEIVERTEKQNIIDKIKNNKNIYNSNFIDIELITAFRGRWDGNRSFNENEEEMKIEVLYKIFKDTPDIENPTDTHLKLIKQYANELVEKRFGKKAIETQSWGFGPQPEPATFTLQMAQLRGMGFYDENLNKKLLEEYKQHKNVLWSVVTELLKQNPPKQHVRKFVFIKKPFKLKNFDLTCFLNSVLHLLFSMQEFITEIRRRAISKNDLICQMILNVYKSMGNREHHINLVNTLRQTRMHGHEFNFIGGGFECSFDVLSNFYFKKLLPEELLIKFFQIHEVIHESPKTSIVKFSHLYEEKLLRQECKKTLNVTKQNYNEIGELCRTYNKRLRGDFSKNKIVLKEPICEFETFFIPFNENGGSFEQQLEKEIYIQARKPLPPKVKEEKIPHLSKVYYKFPKYLLFYMARPAFKFKRPAVKFPKNFKLKSGYVYEEHAAIFWHTLENLEKIREKKQHIPVGHYYSTVKFNKNLYYCDDDIADEYKKVNLAVEKIYKKLLKTYIKIENIPSSLAEQRWGEKRLYYERLKDISRWVIVVYKKKTK